MTILIDWLSFTIPADENIGERYAPLKVMQALTDQALDSIISYNSDWLQTGGRAPFRIGYQSQGVALWVGTQPYILIEIQGVGWQYLRGKPTNGIDRLLRIAENNATRIDLAVDMECATDPAVFVEVADTKRIRCKGVFRSHTGTTVYIGSRKSNRYARVYRYSPPHPRSSMLRCEMVFRGKQAQAAISSILKEGLKATIASSGALWGWRHPNWQQMGLESDTVLNVGQIQRNQNKTVRWLIAQAAPAFRKCVEAGSIDNPDEFIRTHFLTKKEGRK